MQKHIIIGIVFLTTLCGGFAAASDCGMVANTGNISNSEAYKNLTENYKNVNIEGVLPAAAISQAIVNLKNACCLSQEMSNKKVYCDGYPTSKNYPNSLILYDHLLDVGLRRLDGNKDLAYGLPVDPTGEAWRTFIIQAAGDKEGKITAKNILEKYTAARSRGKQILPNARSKIQFENYMRNYNTPETTLADKYYNMCNVIGTIAATFKGTSIGNSFQSDCLALVNKRIADEATYTKIIMIKKSNELLHTSLQAYTQKYFVQEKMMTLMTLVNKIKSLFATMVQQAAVSKTCSK